MPIISKTIFVFILVVTVLLWRHSHGRLPVPEKSVPSYVSREFAYQIDTPDGFVVDISIPELVVIAKNNSRLRINAGCYDSGFENLIRSTETVQLQGFPTLKESYYADSRLRLVRYALIARDTCFALELSATSRDGWQDLEKLIRSFRIN
jgi:hypothetical protein